MIEEDQSRDLRYLMDTIADYLDRSDISDAKIGTFIELAELDLRSLLPPVCPPLPNLTTFDSSNWLLASRPDVYIAATLAEAYHWLNDLPMAATWWGRTYAKIFGPHGPCDSGSEAKPENPERSGGVEPAGSQSGGEAASPETPGSLFTEAAA